MSARRRKAGFAVCTVRLPPYREAAGLGRHKRRRAGDPHTHLAYQSTDGEVRAPSHPHSAGMGHRHGLADGQPVRPAPARARPPARCSSTPESLAPPGGGSGHREGAGAGPGQGGRVGVRVPGADGRAQLRGSRGGVDRDRPRGGCLDSSGEPDEDRARAPGAAVWPGAGNPRCGAEAGQRREFDRVRQRAREDDGRHPAEPAAEEAPDRGSAARVPVQFPGLGGRRDESSSGGGRGGTGRTQVVNALRGHLAEFGVVAARGMARVEKLWEAILPVRRGASRAGSAHGGVAVQPDLRR